MWWTLVWSEIERYQVPGIYYAAYPIGALFELGEAVRPSYALRQPIHTVQRGTHQYEMTLARATLLTLGAHSTLTWKVVS